MMSGVLTAVVTTAAVAVICGGALAAGEAGVATQRAAGAADAAALAAADALSGAVPGDPCAQAARLANANGAELSSCTVAGMTVDVVVSTSVLGFGVTAEARAGPPPAGTDSEEP